MKRHVTINLKYNIKETIGRERLEVLEKNYSNNQLTLSIISIYPLQWFLWDISCRKILNFEVKKNQSATETLLDINVIKIINFYKDWSCENYTKLIIIKIIDKMIEIIIMIEN